MDGGEDLAEVGVGGGAGVEVGEALAGGGVLADGLALLLQERFGHNCANRQV